MPCVQHHGFDLRTDRHSADILLTAGSTITPKMLSSVLFTSLLAALLATPSLVEATGRTHNGHTAAARPSVTPHPHTTGKKFPASPRRTRHCFVDALGNGKDDGPQILAAAKKCNDGGTVALLDDLYILGTALDLTFLKHVDFDIQGTLKFVPDVAFWEKNSFKFTFQGASAMILFGGEDVNVFGSGKGVIDASGQTWWDGYAKNSSIYRPMVIGVSNMNGGTWSGLHLKNPPNWFNWITDSKDLIWDNIVMTVQSNNSNSPKNTDGWDTYRSDNIVIQNSIVNNTDDCVSFKPNSTNILVQNNICTGSHGMSVGSLGQYKGEYDIVENIYVYNTTMNNVGSAARIKVWPGVNPNAVDNGMSGGGGGLVQNITYDTMHINSADWAIELTQCYGQSNRTICSTYPSSLIIQDIMFKNFDGVASKKYDPKVATLVCSSPTVCKCVHAGNINVQPPSGKTPQHVCGNIDRSLLIGLNCVDS
ncbi:Exopolygalacturonase [Dactylella cylindrospora]|nr:Exopolygalacturonase [Dactylella cylindrospora]